MGDVIENKKTPAKEDQAEDVEDEAGDDDEEEEYVVEKIMTHGFDTDGTIKYEVKWQGYESKADRTWEPEENLATASEALEEYFKKIGGRPVFQPKGKKRKQSVGTSANNTPNEKPGGRGRKKTKSSPELEAEAKGTPDPVKDKKDWIPKGSWEQYVTRVDTVEQKPNPKTGEQQRWAFLEWGNGKKTKHPLEQCNLKCPQKMLKYYEQHLVFKDSNEEANGDTDMIHDAGS